MVHLMTVHMVKEEFHGQQTWMDTFCWNHSNTEISSLARPRSQPTHTHLHKNVQFIQMHRHINALW